MANNRPIAVTKSSMIPAHTMSSILDEAAAIEALQHVHLLGLLGYSKRWERRRLARPPGFRNGKVEVVLIYEFLHNPRSLDTVIFGRCSLNWEGRRGIILGVAQGLHYLHEECQLEIVHENLKASNILLNEDMQDPQILDFGTIRIFLGRHLERLMHNNNVSIGNLAPEGQLSLQSDIYHFGVLMLEIVSGRRIVLGEQNGKSVQQAWQLWSKGNGMNLLDEQMAPPIPEAEVLRYIQVGFLCIQEEAERPKMHEIFHMLVNEDPLPVPQMPGPRLKFQV